MPEKNERVLNLGDMIEVNIWLENLSGNQITVCRAELEELARYFLWLSTPFYLHFVLQGVSVITDETNQTGVLQMDYYEENAGPEEYINYAIRCGVPGLEVKNLQQAARKKSLKINEQYIELDSDKKIKQTHSGTLSDGSVGKDQKSTTVVKKASVSSIATDNPQLNKALKMHFGEEDRGLINYFNKLSHTISYHETTLGEKISRVAHNGALVHILLERLHNAYKHTSQHEYIINHLICYPDIVDTLKEIVNEAEKVRE